MSDSWNMRFSAAWFITFVLIVTLFAACAETTPRTSQPVPTTSIPGGWQHYRSPRGDYALYYPPDWMLKGSGGGAEDQSIAPGEDPLTGPVWLSIDSLTEDKVVAEGDPSCYEYNVGNSVYRRLGEFELGGKRAVRFSEATTIGFPGEPGFGTVVNAQVNDRCFRFAFFSPSEEEWKSSEETALQILNTVQFSS